MEKKTLIVFTFLALGLVFSGACFAACHSSEQFHGAFCPMPFHSCGYPAGGFLLFLPLLFKEMLSLQPTAFLPGRFVYTLFKPPQLSF